MLLDDGEEVRYQILFSDDDSFAAQSTAFGPANVEDIAIPGQISQTNIIIPAGQTVSQTGTVTIQSDAVLPADIAEMLQFSQRIDRSIFSWLGNVEHPWFDHVIVVGIIIPVKQIVFHILGFDFA